MLTKPLWYRWLRVYIAGGCIIGTGALLFKYTTPSDEELYQRFSPEIKAESDAKRDFRQRELKELMRIALKTAALDDPIWKTGPIGLPFEVAQRNMSQQLVNYREFQQEAATKFKQDQLNDAMQNLEEIEQLSKKKWYRLW